MMVRTRPERVYAALTQASELQVWMGAPVVGEAIVGSDLEFQFDQGQRILRFKVIRLEPGQLVEWQVLQPAWPRVVGEQVITWRLSPYEATTLVDMRMAGWPTDDDVYASVSYKWASFMVRLKIYMGDARELERFPPVQVVLTTSPWHVSQMIEEASPSTMLTSARTEDLNATMRESIVQLCVAAHQEADFHNLFTNIPSGGRHFLAFHAKTLVSHAVVTTRWLQPQGLPILKTAYVDAVATLPAFQGQGFGSAVMQHLAQNIADYAIACLETDRIDFYARLGWEVWRGALAGRGEQGNIPTPEQTGVMILRLPQTPALDLDGELTIEWQPGRIW